MEIYAISSTLPVYLISFKLAILFIGVFLLFFSVHRKYADSVYRLYVLQLFAPVFCNVYF